MVCSKSIFLRLCSESDSQANNLALQATPRTHGTRYDTSSLASLPGEQQTYRQEASGLTVAQRRNSTRRHTSTTTALQLYVGNNSQAQKYALSQTLTSVTDSQPFSCRSLRRCSRVRARLCHFVFRRPDCLLGQEDRSFTSGQANCAGARLRKGHLVGPSEQAHEHRCTFSLLRLSFLFFFVFWQHIHRSSSLAAWSHDRATAQTNPLHVVTRLVEMVAAVKSSGNDCPLVHKSIRRHWRSDSTRRTLFSPLSRNCGRWRQMLLNATLKGRLLPHMPLVTEIIGATPRPSSCTPLILQPKPFSTSAWRFLPFPPSYPDSREYGNTHETNT